MSRWRGEAGQASIEFGAMFFYVLLAALFAWQMALVGWSFVSATSAARTTSRMLSRGVAQDDAFKAGHDSLSGRYLDTNSKIWAAPGSDKTWVTVRVPIVVPGVSSPLHVTEDADLPPTG